MKRSVIFAAVLSLIGVSSAIAEDKCSVPKAEWQPEQALRQKLEAAQWKIKNVKIDDGCYEVYGIDEKGAKVEVYFNPKTLEPVNNSKG